MGERFGQKVAEAGPEHDNELHRQRISKVMADHQRKCTCRGSLAASNTYSNLISVSQHIFVGRRRWPLFLEFGRLNVFGGIVEEVFDCAFLD